MSRRLARTLFEREVWRIDDVVKSGKTRQFGAGALPSVNLRQRDRHVNTLCALTAEGKRRHVVGEMTADEIAGGGVYDRSVGHKKYVKIFVCV